MNHKYEVGDKGFMRDGKSEYEVMLIDPSVEKSLIIKVTLQNGRQYYTQYRIDGRYLCSGDQDGWDLTPPKEYVWVNWVRHPTLGVASVAFGTEEKANEQRYDKSAWTIIKLAVKTEVPSKLAATANASETD